MKNEDSSEDIVFRSRPEGSKSKGMLIGMICLAILAIGGIGFGVWAMMDGNDKITKKDEQINNLNSQLAEKEAPVISEEIVDGEDGEDGEISNDYNATNAAGYIYVSEWGVKIGVPDSLEVVTYTYDYGTNNTALSVSGATKEGGQMLPDFARVSKCKLGVVERYSTQAVEMGSVPSYYGEPFMSDSDFSYYYSGPQMLCTEVQDYAQWEQGSAEAIKNMLIDVDNYSKI